VTIRPIPLLLAIPLAACSPKGDTGSTLQVGETMSSTWALEDVNPTSPTFEQAVSPADLIGQVSVWYFGHST